MNEQLYHEFLEWLSIAHSKETVKSYQYGLKVFLDWCYGTEKEVLKLKDKDFVEYGVFLQKRQVKHSTIANYFCSVRTFIRWLYNRKLLEFDDKNIPIPKNDDKEHYPFVLEGEVNLILSSFNDFFPEDLRAKAIIKLLFATGVRLGELLSLNAEQINLEAQKTIIKTSKRTNHEREVYWDKATNEILRKWLLTREQLMIKSIHRSNALFVALKGSHSGQRLTNCAVQKILRLKRKELGIEKNITAHSFRHGFGHKAIEKDVHPRHLQIMLGHAKLNTTMIYMGVNIEEIEKSYRSKMD